MSLTWYVQQYIDTLLKDLGINTRRKPNPFANLFVPIYPRDYRGLLDEFRKVRERKKLGQPSANTWTGDGEGIGEAGVRRFILVTVVFVAVILSLTACLRGSSNY